MSPHVHLEEQGGPLLADPAGDAELWQSDSVLGPTVLVSGKPFGFSPPIKPGVKHLF